MLSKSLIQFSVEGWGCVPSLFFDLRTNYGGGNEDNGNLLQKVPCTHCYTQCPKPSCRPPPTHASARDSWTFTVNLGQSLMGSLLLSPGSCNAQHSVCALQESVSPEQYEKTKRTLKEELPRSVGAHYATGEEWRTNSRRNEGMEPKQKRHPVVDGTGDGSRV